MADLGTVAVSVGASSVVAALVTGIIAHVNERKKQLRERSLVVAGDFAGAAMEVLAQLRYYRPTKRRGHRNELLHTDPELVRLRAEAVSASLDAVRPMRGRVWMFFPGRSSEETIAQRGPRTTSDWAEEVVIRLQKMHDVCHAFWRGCEENPAQRDELERQGTADYRAARMAAWEAVDRFTATAARRV